MASPESTSDQELLRAIQARDSAALRALFERYGPTALALAQRVVRDPMLAEDVLQESFLAVWERPGAYEAGRGTVRAFLFTIVHNRAVDRVRRESAQQRRVDVEASLGVPDEPGIDELVAESADGALRRKQVRIALGDLPDEQRRIIELMYFDGLTQRQVSERLSLPLGTVKSRTLLAMRKLRVALAGASTERPL